MATDDEHEDLDEDEDADDFEDDPEAAKFEDLAFAWRQAKHVLDLIVQVSFEATTPDRKALLDRLELEINRGILAAVGHVLISDSNTEDDGIEAMARVAPLVVELQAMLPLGRRLLRKKKA